MNDARTPGVLVAHPTLNANVRQASLALAEGGMLAELHTSIAVGPRLGRVASIHPSWSRTLEKRRVPDATAPFAHSHPLPELRRLLARRLPQAARLLGAPDLHRMYASFDGLAARRVSDRLGAVLGYEDGALDTFVAASRHGLPSVYDLPIPYWRMKHDLLEEEAEANPAWAPLLGGLDDPSWVLDRKTAELEAADLVLTASTLSTASVRAAAPTKRVVQVPYGCPEPATSIRPSTGGPLRALYVGSLTQRKGLSYLFDAVESVGADVELTVIGSGAPAGVDVLQQALARHRHVPAVPHHQMAATMRAHDVLLLPSIVEGFGLVINEALAQGVPVIATDRTGAVDLYDDDTAHWLVPASDSQSIAALLDGWARDRDLLNAAKLDALEVARRSRWSDYRAGVRQTLRDLIAERSSTRR